MQRIHSLGKKAKTGKTVKEVSKECILNLKKDYSSPEFNYNEGFSIINMDLNLRIPEEKGG